jgi:opacity protein-like surface antigen
MSGRLAGSLFALLMLLVAPAAFAFDAAATFQPRSFVISPEVGYGQQYNLENRRSFSDLEMMTVGVRFGWLPFAPAGPGPLHGSFEVGLEPFYQRYLEPHDAFFAGLGVTGRYHFLALGRFVPYLEGAAFAGGTDLKIPEIDSEFTFLLWAGAGASVFIADRTALYAGYRYQHVSNGNTKHPNRGFEAHTGVVGVSFFFK